MNSESDPRQIKVIDTHQHLWEPGRFPYSWCKEIPALNRNFQLDDYREAIRDVGIDQTVFVECDVDDPHQLDEARHIQQLADINPLIGGIVAGCRPERDGFEAHLEELKKLSKVKGVRRVLHVVPDETSQPPLFSNNVRRLTQYDLSFDLCVLARQLPLAVALIEKCPDVSFILDHCGVPDIKAGAFEPWREHLAQVASNPNVVCKVSGLVVYADSGKWTAADLRPWVDHVVDCFGWERVMWGSDWPVCTLAATIQQWMSVTGELVSAATPQQQHAFFHGNARRIYRLGA